MTAQDTAPEVVARLLRAFKTGTDTNGASEAAAAFLARSAHPPAEPAAPVALACYDAGLLNDYGGGNVDWWQDYIRAELNCAHEFYQEQVNSILEPKS